MILNPGRAGSGHVFYAVLPDLRGRIPVGVGQGLGLSNWTLGGKAGAESVVLTVEQLPAHNHQVPEPSGALVMLLGVAGALRRRRR